MSRYFQKGQYQSTVALILYLLYAKSCPKSNQPLFRQVVRCGVKLAFAKCNLSTNNRLHNMLYTQPWSLVCLSTLACRPLSLESYLWAAFVLSPPRPPAPTSGSSPWKTHTVWAFKASESLTVCTLLFSFSRG